MRKNRKYLTLLLAAALAVGCSDVRKTASSKLLGAVNTARRYYNNASSLMSTPQFLDLSANPPRAPRGTKVASTQKLVAATEPALDNQIPQLLNKAKSELQTALNENEQASDTVKATAYQLLGDVQHALGQYQSLAADLALARAADDRDEALAQAGAAGNLVSLARFQAALAQMPKTEVTAMRDQAAKAVAAATAAIATHQKEIAALEQTNAQLLETDKTLLEQAAELNDQAEQSNATKKLELMTQSEALKSKVTANSSQISANQHAIRRLTTEIAFENINLATNGEHLKGLDEHLAMMAQKGQQVSSDRQQNLDAAAKAFDVATAAANRSAAQCKLADDNDKAAVTAFTDAVKQYQAAERAVSDEIRAAQAVQQKLKPGKTDSLLTSLTDDQHLVNIITARAASQLRLANLYARQLAVVAATKTLDDEMAKATGAVKGGSASQPTTSKADSAKIAKLADDAYRGAVKDLESVTKGGRLTQSAAKNTQWIYQGMLARAYMGQFQLTGDQAALRNAATAVDKATLDREYSPNLSAIVELSQLIHSYMPTASMPVSMPASRPAAAPAAARTPAAPAAPVAAPPAAPAESPAPAAAPAAPAAPMGSPPAMPRMGMPGMGPPAAAEPPSPAIAPTPGAAPANPAMPPSPPIMPAPGAAPANPTMPPSPAIAPTPGAAPAAPAEPPSPPVMPAPGAAPANPTMPPSPAIAPSPGATPAAPAEPPSPAVMPSSN